MVHNMETEADQGQEINIETENINLVKFNSNHSAVIANLKTSSSKVIITVPYKVDTGSNGNIMPLSIYKKLFPRVSIEQLSGTRDTIIKLKT